MGSIDVVHVIDTGNRAIGRDDDDLHVVDLLEFLFLGLGGAGHAGHLLVEAEEVLVGDGGQNGGLLLDLHAFLGLDCLLKSVVVLAAFEDTAGELVDQLDGPILVHHVFDVAVHDVVGLKGLMDAVDQLLVPRIVEVADAEHPFGLVRPGVGKRAGLGLDVDREIALGLKAFDEAVGDHVLASRGLLTAGDD